jgi:AcrR family transcriptional regulator
MKSDSSRKTYHHGSLEHDLVRLARETVEEHGPDSLSLRELARRLGVSPNAPYRHFKDRDELLFAVAKSGFADLAERFRASDASLEAIGDAYVAFALDHRHLFRLMFSGRVAAMEPDFEPDAAFTMLLQAVSARMGVEPDAPEALEASLGAWALAHGVAMLRMESILDQEHCLDIPSPAHLMRAMGPVMKD